MLSCASRVFVCLDVRHARAFQVMHLGAVAGGFRLGYAEEVGGSLGGCNRLRTPSAVYARFVTPMDLLLAVFCDGLPNPDAISYLRDRVCSPKNSYHTRADGGHSAVI